MIKKLFQKILLNFGKSYSIDTNIPDKLLLGFLFNRMTMLIRGMVLLRKKIFLGKNSIITNKKNIEFGKSVTIENNCIIDGYAQQRIKIGDGSRIGAFSTLSCTSHLSFYGVGLQMGSNSAVGKFTEFGAAGGIIIGNDVIMGSYISFHSENHNFKNTSKLIREQGVTHNGIILGNNIWVGAKVAFLDGAVVGNNCVVAAGAVVTGKFPDNVIIGGVPAKILKTIET